MNLVGFGSMKYTQQAAKLLLPVPLVLLLIFTMFQLQRCEDADDFKPENVQLLSLKIFGEPQYMNVSARIHSNRTRIDIHSMLKRELGSNYLIMNMRLRVLRPNSLVFREMFVMRGIDFCAFLTEFKDNSMLQYFFRKSLQLSDYIVCPIRVGRYDVLNIGAGDSIYPDSLPSGRYKFFVEIVEATGEIPKIFAMQVTLMLNSSAE